MSVANGEADRQARRRLRDLVATFPFGGTSELHGEQLDQAVRVELDKLPVVEAEVWLSVHGYALRMAVKYPLAGP